MTAQRLTDAQIAAALRAHLPEQATPGLRGRVMDTIESTAQQRPVPTMFAPMFDADPLSRRRMLLLVAALLLAVALAGAAAVGALRLLDRNPTPELSLEPPSDVAGFVDSVYDRLPNLPAVAITTLEDGTIKKKTYVDRSGALRIERYPDVTATEAETYTVRNRDHVSDLAMVGPDKVWLDGSGSISEDPRVFLLAETTPNLAHGSTCTDETDGSAAAGWHYVGLEYVVGRPTHHVQCEDADLWIDVETALFLRSRGPVVDDTGTIVADTYRTIEVVELAFGDQPAALFSFAKPEGVAEMSQQDYVCAKGGAAAALDPNCIENPSPAPIFTPSAGTSPAALPPPPTRLPDSGWIAYVAQPTIGGDGPSDIYMVREGVAPKLLVGGDYKHGHNSCPAFSPDGSKLAYATAGDGPTYEWLDPAIVVIELDDAGSRVGDEIRIPASGDLPCPKWSADGRAVAYSLNGNLMVTRLGGDTTTIPGPSPNEHWGDFVLSPVDDLIAAIGPGGIWLIPIDGGAPTLLREATGQFDYLSWAPDGSRLAVTTEIVANGSGGPGPIRVIRVDGTEPDREFGSSLERASWSPTGDRIAYTGPDGIVIVAPDGSDRRTIPAKVKDPEGRGSWDFGYAFMWSPDGRRLLSVAHADWVLMTSEWALMAINTTRDSAPVVMTEPTMDLYAIQPRDVSWQAIPR